MVQGRILFALCTSAVISLAVPSAHAATPTAVSNWNGEVSLPSDVSMYAYVPAKVAAKPPLLVLIHFCGGSAQAVFGQAEGGGLVSAADQYGFVLVVPSNADASGKNGRCWDVTSSKAQKRDGGGDTHAIMQMVKFALTKYQANADRVYVTGDSSGGMTTQLMLALYPDVFKAGSSFAGVPAGCSNVFDGTGLCGLPAQTAQQWGARVRAMYTGYSGRRPRVQLFHGDADTTITYKNFAESIEEWTDVLGLPMSPTSTDATLTLGTHKATRQSWKNTCGYVALDAFTSQGGDHGPSDTLFVAKYVVPFLGLDKTSDVDPEVAQCAGAGAGSGGAGGAGGGTGGGAPAGGAAGVSSGGQSGSSTSGGTGGSVAGGTAAGGSSAGQSGSPASGGTVGASGSAGAQVGGAQGLAGALGSAGQSSSSGTAGVSAGTGAGDGSSNDASSGCSCVLAKSNSNSASGTAALAFGLALIGSVFRRRNRG